MTTGTESKGSDGCLRHRVPGLGPCLHPFLLTVRATNVVLAVPRPGQKDHRSTTKPYMPLNATVLLSLSRHPWVLDWIYVGLSEYLPEATMAAPLTLCSEYPQIPMPLRQSSSRGMVTVLLL